VYQYDATHMLVIIADWKDELRPKGRNGNA
jgi:hypothetical protein